jgi:hypothetical protein
MMAVWAEDEEIICVHPGGARLSGPEEVRASWARIFSAGVGPRVHITQQVALTAMMIAVHSVHENFTVEGDARAQVPVIATNVYLRNRRRLAHDRAPRLAPRRFRHRRCSRRTLRRSSCIERKRGQSNFPVTLRAVR